MLGGVGCVQWVARAASPPPFVAAALRRRRALISHLPEVEQVILLLVPRAGLYEMGGEYKRVVKRGRRESVRVAFV